MRENGKSFSILFFRCNSIGEYDSRKDLTRSPGSSKAGRTYWRKEKQVERNIDILSSPILPSHLSPPAVFFFFKYLSTISYCIIKM